MYLISSNNSGTSINSRPQMGRSLTLIFHYISRALKLVALTDAPCPLNRLPWFVIRRTLYHFFTNQQRESLPVNFL